MHEVGIATEIYQQCRHRLDQTVPEGHTAKIRSVTIAVGELAAVDPDQLRYAWSAVVADSIDATSHLVVEWRPAKQVCKHCQAEPQRPEHGWLKTCPKCQHPLGITGGDELEVLRLQWDT